MMMKAVREVLSRQKAHSVLTPLKLARSLARSRADKNASQKEVRRLNYSRPRWVHAFVMASWETKPQPDLNEAVPPVDEAAEGAHLTQGRGRRGLGRGDQVWTGRRGDGVHAPHDVAFAFAAHLRLIPKP